MSSRSCAAASSCRSASKARVWMSSRWGMSIPCSSFPNEICFIISGMYHPRAGENGATPGGSGENSGLGGVALKTSVVERCCNQLSLEVEVRDEESHRASAGGIPPRSPPVPSRPLLHLDGRALLLELGPDRRGLVLCHARLHRLGRAVDEILRFLQAQAGDLANHLDHLDLLRAGFLEVDRELGLLLGRRGRGRRTATAATAHRGRGDRDVEL